jgi:hypothetical protein
MRKIWFGPAFVAFAAIIAEPAPAQDNHRSVVECAKELGLQLDPNAQRLQDGRGLRRWYFHSEAQEGGIQRLCHPESESPSKPSAKGPSRVSR